MVKPFENVHELVLFPIWGRYEKYKIYGAAGFGMVTDTLIESSEENLR
jgi:hypothetical protein